MYPLELNEAEIRLLLKAIKRAHEEINRNLLVMPTPEQREELGLEKSALTSLEFYLDLIKSTATN